MDWFQQALEWKGTIIGSVALTIGAMIIFHYSRRRRMPNKKHFRKPLLNQSDIDFVNSHVEEKYTEAEWNLLSESEKLFIKDYAEEMAKRGYHVKT